VLRFPDALPPEPSDDAPEWLMERLGNGVKRHFPASGPVERGMSASASVAGTKQLHEQAAEEFPHNLEHAHGIAQRPIGRAIAPAPQNTPLFSAAGNRADGTAGRSP
jgi:hypothetical protein